MGNTPPGWSPRQGDDVLTEPEKFLAELGWSAAGPAPAAAPAKRPVVQRLYCSFCWCVLPTGAETCTDCGKSVAEMESSRTARVAEDKNWTPPRLWKDGKAPPPARPTRAGRIFQARGATPVRAIPVVTQNAVMLSWKQVLVAIAAGGFIGGATVVGLWALLQNSRPGGEAGVNAALTSLAPAELTWKNPVQELRLELVSGENNVVADSTEARDNAPIAPGEYRLRIRDNTGRWTPPVERVQVEPGKPVVLGPSPRVIAGFYLWAGKNLYQQRKLDRAERVWAKAVKAYPEGSDARLQLAALLAVRFRYSEARQHVEEVIKRQPKNPEAQRLARMLDELEKRP